MVLALLVNVFIIVGLLQLSIASRCAQAPHASKAHIAIGFYGVTRSLSNVLYTFENHLFKVLDKENVAYDVFSVTMGTSSAVPTRGSKTSLGPLDPFDVQLLQPCRFSILDQNRVRLHEFSLFKAARGMTHRNLTIYKHLDEFEDEFDSIKNVLCAYHTQRELLSLIRTHEHSQGFKYDALLVLRPDTAMVRDIDLTENLPVIRQDNRSIWLPDFQHWAGYNDRLAYGSLPAMSVYLHRGQLFRDAPGIFPVAERLVKYALARNNITVQFTTARVLRVRQNRWVFEAQRVMNMTDTEWNRCIQGGVLTKTC